jgi:hypothetical protein
MTQLIHVVLNSQHRLWWGRNSSSSSSSSSSNIFLTLNWKNSATQFRTALMQSVHYCTILTKIGTQWQVLVQLLNVKFELLLELVGPIWNLSANGMSRARRGLQTSDQDRLATVRLSLVQHFVPMLNLLFFDVSVPMCHDLSLSTLRGCCVNTASSGRCRSIPFTDRMPLRRAVDARDETRLLICCACVTLHLQPLCAGQAGR